MNVLKTAAAWIDEGRTVALATVVATWRSSPCPAGSRMVIDDGGRFAGSVSGGCVESAVVDAARRFLADGKAVLLSYGVAQERAWEVGLACGGRVEVLLGPVDREVLERILEARRRRRLIALLTRLDDGTQSLIDPADLESGDHDTRDRHAAADASLRELLKAHPFGDIDSVVGAEPNRVFVQLLAPAPRLVIVGAVHLAQVLARLAGPLGFRVIVVDPRTAFADVRRFPDVEIVSKWPDRALRDLELDCRTAVVTLSHDAKLDEPALATALESDCFYIGALGGRKTQASRRNRLIAAGCEEGRLGRIHGPVGLSIGARSAEEIGLAIMAEIVATRRTPAGDR